jgi:hypothetical protein
MNRKGLKFLTIIFVCLGIAYLLSYVAIRLVKPEIINTHNGPVLAFQQFYYPLRYLEAARPKWYSKAKSNDFWLEAKNPEINRGNGYLYFTWEGEELRIFLGTDHAFPEADTVWLHVIFELDTLDDFTSRLVPTIDKIKPSKDSPN